jgi:hypothetical protein
MWRMERPGEARAPMSREERGMEETAMRKRRIHRYKTLEDQGTLLRTQRKSTLTKNRMS